MVSSLRTPASHLKQEVVRCSIRPTLYFTLLNVDFVISCPFEHRSVSMFARADALGSFLDRKLEILTWNSTIDSLLNAAKVKGCETQFFMWTVKQIQLPVFSDHQTCYADRQPEYKTQALNTLPLHLLILYFLIGHHIKM